MRRWDPIGPRPGDADADVPGSLPLSGRVCIQDPSSLHPCPDGVHPGAKRFLFQDTPAPLDALLNPEHEIIVGPLSFFRGPKFRFL